MTILLLVMVGGAVGATGRFLTDRAVSRWRTGPLPWGTLVVNVTGSLLLGLLAGAGATLPGWVGALLGTGFCGALTTYSTFGHETFQLLTADQPIAGPSGRLLALLNIAATLVAGFAAAALGWLLAAAR